MNMRLNVRNSRLGDHGPVTHEGAPARRIPVEDQLRRSVMSCLLWEGEFYEDGRTIADRILDLAIQCKPSFVAELAAQARNEWGLRHVPLLLAQVLIRTGGPGIAEQLAAIIRRPDEIAEIIAIYWSIPGNKHMLPKQLKKAIGICLRRAKEETLAKYDRDGAVRLRDALFLSHADPRPSIIDVQAGASPDAFEMNNAFKFKKLAEKKLIVPDTWEVALSGGQDKKETFERLIREGKLGYLALLRNLRGMLEVGCDVELIKTAILARQGAELVWPFRYTAAARAAPQLEPWIDRALLAAIEESEPLSGTTVVLVDVSQSMTYRLSSKSDLTRMDAAATLASMIGGTRRVFSFSQDVVEVPPRLGMAGVDAILRSQPYQGTHLFDAVARINRDVNYDRMIVITDEQASGQYGSGMIQGTLRSMPYPKARGYVINVASAKNGVGYGPWVHIDGFSEAVLRYLREYERSPELS
jgi:60 kDa SS-A/Ro ribonucleoprotein